MRLDIDEGQWAGGYYAYMNGQLLDGCVMADEEAGIAEVVEFEPPDPERPLTKRPILDAGCPRGFRTRIVWGQVELRYQGSPEIDQDIRRMKQRQQRSAELCGNG